MGKRVPRGFYLDGFVPGINSFLSDESGPGVMVHTAIMGIGDSRKDGIYTAG